LGCGFVYVEPDINLGNLPGEFFEHRFILLEDWREQQLNKIL